SPWYTVKAFGSVVAAGAAPTRVPPTTHVLTVPARPSEHNAAARRRQARGRRRQRLTTLPLPARRRPRRWTRLAPAPAAPVTGAPGCRVIVGGYRGTP